MSGLKLLLMAGQVTPGTPTDWDNTDASAIVYSGGACDTYIYLGADGSISLQSNGDFTPNQPQTDWLNPQQGMGQFEVQCVQNVGTVTSTNAAVGAGNWTALGSGDLYWHVHSNSGSNNSKSCTMTFTVRKIGTITPTYVSSGVTIGASTDTGPPP